MAGGEQDPEGGDADGASSVCCLRFDFCGWSLGSNGPFRDTRGSTGLSGAGAAVVEDGLWMGLELTVLRIDPR